MNEVYRASVTRFITMSLSHEANEGMKDEGSSSSLTDLRFQRKRKIAARMSNMRLSRENEPPVKQLCHEDAGDNQVSSKIIFTAYNG